MKKWRIIFWFPEIRIVWNFRFSHGLYPYEAISKKEAIFEYWRIGFLDVRRML